MAAFRLARHHLAEGKPAGLATVCRDVCGVQAQVMGAARIALWARARGVTAAEIESALWKRRTLVKTSCMRGTLHLLSAEDFPIYIRALEGSRTRTMLKIMARYGVTPNEAEAVTRAVVEALRSGPQTRRELTGHVVSLEILGKKAKKWFELTWWGVARQALVRGLISYGPEQGQETTFVGTDQWIPNPRVLSERDAQQILLHRYLRAYGPATLQDFCRWAGMPVNDAKAIWESLVPEMAEVSVEGRRGWILRKDSDRLRNSDLGKPILRLLPSFDSYLLGHADKTHLVDARHYKHVFRNAGWISPAVLLNGRVIGV